MKRKISLSVLALGVSLALVGCDQSNSDSINIHDLMTQKTADTPAKSDKEKLEKVNVDELLAINAYVSSLNGGSIPEKVTLKDVVEDVNILQPDSPILRGKISSTYDYYYRDLFLMSIQGIGDPAIIGKIKSCLSNPPDALKVKLSINPASLDGYQFGKIYNICYPQEKISYNSVMPKQESNSNDDVRLRSEKFENAMKAVKTPEDMSKALNSVGLNADEFMVLGAVSSQLKDPNPTIKEVIDIFNSKYPAAPVVRGKLTIDNAYMRDLNVLNQFKKISDEDKNKISTCYTKLATNTFPYNKIKDSPNREDIFMNTPISKLLSDCKEAK